MGMAVLTRAGQPRPTVTETAQAKPKSNKKATVADVEAAAALELANTKEAHASELAAVQAQVRGGRGGSVRHGAARCATGRRPLTLLAVRNAAGAVVRRLDRSLAGRDARTRRQGRGGRRVTAGAGEEAGDVHQ